MKPNYDDPVLTTGLPISIQERITRLDYVLLISGLLCGLSALILDNPYSDVLITIRVCCVIGSIVCLGYKLIRWSE